MSETKPTLVRSIWEKSWHEPRHFFFWLTLVSPVIYLMTLLMIGLAGPLLFIKWVALAAILAFLIGAPAFMLSWIPPVGQLFTRLLRHKLLVLACLITLVAMFYAVENWRGRTAWNNFRREWEARGVEFQLDKIVPPPIAEAENMYEAEPWRGFHFIKSEGGAITFENTNVQNEAWFDCTGPNHREAPEGTDVFLARQVNLAEWQKFYRSTNNQFASPGGGLTNYFPVAAAPQTPAKDVLLALSKFDGRLNQIRAAAQRPKARFWVNFEDGFAALIPHLAKFKSIATYLRLRSTALLADGQTDAAFDDLMLAFRLDQALQNEPILISHLVRLAVLQVNLSTLWEGLADHRWSEAQLAAFEAELATMDLLAEYQSGMNGERYFSMWCVDFLYRTGDFNSISGPAESGNSSFSDQLLAANGRATFHLIPRGWFDQNKVSLGKMHVDYIRPMVDVEKQLVLPANLRRTAAALKSYRPTPYNLFAGLLLPALENTAKKTAYAHTCVNLARVACGLERYRLANGKYPESLDAIAPQFISKLPHDVIDGQPLKYRRNAEGSFILYSVGWNETDDGGTVAMRKANTPSVDQDKGDWVWRYPAKSN
jgi:hypothetical protein